MNYDDMSEEQRLEFSDGATLVASPSGSSSGPGGTTRASSSQPPSSATSAGSQGQGDYADPWKIVHDVKIKMRALKRALQEGNPTIDKSSDAGFNALKSLFLNLEEAQSHVRQTAPDKSWHTCIADAMKNAEELESVWSVHGTDKGLYGKDVAASILQVRWPGIRKDMVAIGKQLGREAAPDVLQVAA